MNLRLPPEKIRLNSDFRCSKYPPDQRLKLAEKAGWTTKPEAGTFRGVAVHESFGSFVAQVAEVTVSKAGQVKGETRCLRD